MSSPGPAQQIATLLSGRWQIPIALAAALVGSVMLYRLMPSRATIDFGGLLADVTALEQAGATGDAADALVNLLEMKPPLPPPQRAELHDRLAETIYGQELGRHTPNLANVRVLLEHHQAAAQLGCPQDAGRLLRFARVVDWLGDEAQATAAYRAVLEHDPLPEQRRLALQGLVGCLEAGPERRRHLAALLSDEGVSASYLWWALRQSLQEALDENDTVRARLMLGRYGSRLKSSDLKGYLEYLWAWVMVHEGRPEEAAPLVEWVDEWLGRRSIDERELREFGDLPAMNRWLLGQIHLSQGRPQAALETFDEALALQPLDEFFIVATIGKGRALAELKSHQAARQVFSKAMERLATVPFQPRGAVPRLRSGLLELFQQLEAEGDYASAADYLALAIELAAPRQMAERAELLDKLGRTCQRAADGSSDIERRREYRAQAGRHLEQAAELASADELRYASLLWSAAQEYDQAGQTADTRRVLERFVEGRSDDPRLPRAFLLLGQAYEAEGEFKAALYWYGRVWEGFPKLEEACLARLRAAGCRWALGQDAEAEADLRGLLADDNIAPRAAVFHDALLELSELLYEQGRYGEAIGRLEDFAALYPQDRERYRSRFMLADAYRRGGLALREDVRHGGRTLRENPPAEVDAARIEAVAGDRFRRGAEWFSELQADLEAEPVLDESLELYKRLALFYRADCLFEINEPEAMGEALELYQQAAALYEREPPALTAQVQIANIYVRMGCLREAARAVERARWLLPSIPPSAFEAYADDTDREQWNRYLSAVSSSDLFRGVFEGGR